MKPGIHTLKVYFIKNNQPKLNDIQWESMQDTEEHDSLFNQPISIDEINKSIKKIKKWNIYR